MNDCVIEFNHGLLGKNREELTRELSGMDRKTIDSLLCTLCSLDKTKEKCDYTIAFRKSEDDYVNRQTGKVGELFYHFICAYKLSGYDKSKGAEEKK
jgi:hypothetical protein